MRVQKTSRFKIKKNTAIKKWHSRARLIDIRKTKLTLIKLEKTCTDDSSESEERTEEIVATPVTVMTGSGDLKEPWMQVPASFIHNEEKIEGTPVEITPI